ncbi:hypothetical protein B0F90DRAFT_1920710 [Multifurca ochricompacta]|uniref:ABM domain-containing protein n=1 Tax=Multifurca ochricompacta TaxID=376703 RepID=A0AAD4LUF8_9AGAM|nr:hypothetical protein B0F90DRAFT_1920710 [Multifurca ochricompacta]
MADKTFEIAFWSASEEYYKDPSTAAAAFNYAVTRKGVSTLFHGTQAEETKLGLFVERVGCAVAWDSHQDYQKFVLNDHGEHTKLRELLAPTRGGTSVEKVHGTFTTDPYPALQAPVTEFAFVKVKSEADVEKVETALNNVVALAGDPTSPLLAAATGSLIDQPTTLLLAVGWSSIEAHKEAIKGGTALDSIHRLVTLQVYHFYLNQVKREGEGTADNRSAL